MKNKTGETLLSVAVKGRKKDMVQTLIDRGADVNKKDDDGLCPSMIAQEHDDDYIYQLLSSEGKPTSR